MAVKTTYVDRNNMNADIEKLREQGVPEEKLALVSAVLDDFAVTTGDTLEELEELRAKVPENLKLQLVKWIAIHPRVDL